MKRHNKTESQNTILLCVLCFLRQPFRLLFYFTAASGKCCVAALKCADYIFISFGIIEPILVTLKMKNYLHR